MAEEKRCAKCKKVKLLTKFYRCSAVLDGRQSYCMKCAQKVVKQHKRRLWLLESFEEVPFSPSTG